MVNVPLPIAAVVKTVDLILNEALYLSLDVAGIVGTEACYFIRVTVKALLFEQTHADDPED